MGTETIVVLLSLNSLTLLIVKLNNPLMGTETQKLGVIICSRLKIKLN